VSQNWVSARERRGRSDEREERVRKFQRRRFCKPSLFFFRERKETGVQKRCFFFLSSYLHLHAQRERERGTTRAPTARSRVSRPGERQQRLC